MAKEDEIKTLQYPEGDVICWSPAYAKRELLPDDPNAPAIILGLLQCQMTPPDREYEAVSNMTGRYEGSESLCCVNQAGYHMELWFSMKEGGRKVSRYGADYNPLAAGERVTFEIRESGDATAFLDPATPGLTRSDPVGLLTIVGLFSFEIQWSDGIMLMFRRFSPRATLSDQVIQRLRDEKFGHGNPIIAGWLANEHAPVSEKDAKRLEDVIIHDRVDEKEPSFRQLLRDLFAIEPERQAEIHIAILAIKNRINKLTHGVFVKGDKERVASRMVPLLLRSTLNIRNPSGVYELRTRYAWLQRVIAYNREHTLKEMLADIAPIIDWLGVQPTSAFRYEYEGAFGSCQQV